MEAFYESSFYLDVFNPFFIEVMRMFVYFIAKMKIFIFVFSLFSFKVCQ